MVSALVININKKKKEMLDVYINEVATLKPIITWRIGDVDRPFGGGWAEVVVALPVGRW